MAAAQKYQPTALSQVGHPLRFAGKWFVPVNVHERLGPYPTYSAAMKEFRVRRDDVDLQVDTNTNHISGDI